MKFELFESGHLRHPHQKHNPCYRTVISYTLYRLRQVENNIEIVDEEFIRMLRHFNDRKTFVLDGYLEMYATNMSETNEAGGYVIVDASRGCCPLVVYPSVHTYNDAIPNKTRMSGLIVAVDDLSKKKESILQIIDTTDPWEKVEPKLQRVFSYQKPANDESYVSDVKTG